MWNTRAVSNDSYLVLEAEHFDGSVRLRQPRQRFRLSIRLQARGLAARSDSDQKCAGCEHARHPPHQTSFAARNSTNASLMLQETVAESGAQVGSSVRLRRRMQRKTYQYFCNALPAAHMLGVPMAAGEG